MHNHTKLVSHQTFFVLSFHTPLKIFQIRSRQVFDNGHVVHSDGVEKEPSGSLSPSLELRPCPSGGCLYTTVHGDGDTGPVSYTTLCN